MTRLSFDTNILFYAVDRNAGAKHGVAASLLQRSVMADAVILQQTLGEFLAVNNRKKLLPAQIATTVVSNWAGALPVIRTELDDLLAAATIAERLKLQFWDAVICATAKAAEVDLLVTEDFQHGQNIDGVTLVNPFLPTGHALLDAALAQA